MACDSRQHGLAQSNIQSHPEMPGYCNVLRLLDPHCIFVSPSTPLLVWHYAHVQLTIPMPLLPTCRAATTGLLDPVTAEKQISLLSRGLVHHPSSTQLLLALLRCYAAVAPDADALEAKWAAVLARQGGSWELWREYIALRYVNEVSTNQHKVVV